MDAADDMGGAVAGGEKSILTAEEKDALEQARCTLEKASKRARRVKFLEDVDRAFDWINCSTVGQEHMAAVRLAARHFARCVAAHVPEGTNIDEMVEAIQVVVMRANRKIAEAHRALEPTVPARPAMPHEMKLP